MIPTYNQAHFLPIAIESALAQDYPNLEVIISDDNSTDYTEEVVRPYLSEHRLKYYKNEANIGRVANYKKLLEEYATGDWIVNLDGDDYYTDSHFISEAIDKTLENDNVVFVQGGKIKKINGEEFDSLPPAHQSVEVLSGMSYWQRFAVTGNFSHMCTVYNRQMAIRINFYRMDVESADVESFLRLALHGNVVLIKRAFGVWVGHAANFSRIVDVNIKERNLQYVLSVYEYAFKLGLNKDWLDAWQLEAKRTYLINWWSGILHEEITHRSNVPLFSILFYLVRKHPYLMLDLRFWKSLAKYLITRIYF